MTTTPNTMAAENEPPIQEENQLKSQNLPSSNQQRLCLRWNDYNTNLINSFLELRNNEQFLDVSLVTEDGHTLNAHKIILSASSQFFRDILKDHPAYDHPIIILKDITHQNLESILNFMYNGLVQINQSELNSFLNTAQYLQIKGLTECNQESNTGCSEINTGTSTTTTTTTGNSKQKRKRRLSTSDELINSNSNSPINTFHESDLIPEVTFSEGSCIMSPSHNPVSTPTVNVNGGTEAAENNTASINQLSNNIVTEAITASNKNISDIKMNSILIQALEQGTRHQKEFHESINKKRRSSFEHFNNENHRFNGNSPPIQEKDYSSENDGDENFDHNNMKMNENIDSSESGDELSSHSASLVESLRFPGSAAAAALLQHGFHGLPGFPPGIGLGGNGTNLTLSTSQNNSNPDSQYGPRTTGSSSHHSRSLELLRVRATDPRPCPKCGKIYRSAHTLRTHLEDKHTTCPGYRCVLCGTVAKSRNSLHSHMSRQHRGISTKDLPVLPMPSPFDPVLAQRLLNKAQCTGGQGQGQGAKYGQGSADGQQQQGDSTQATSSNNASGRRSSAADHSKNKGATSDMSTAGNVPIDASTTGSAILDTYLQFIAENSLALSSLHHYANAGHNSSGLQLPHGNQLRINNNASDTEDNDEDNEAEEGNDEDMIRK